MRVKQSKYVTSRSSAAQTPKRHVRQKVTINLDADIIDFFKLRAEEEGTPYQFLINQVLRDNVRGNRVDQLAKEVSQLLLDDPSFIEKVLTFGNLSPKAE